jgi:hypothetical protein
MAPSARRPFALRQRTHPYLRQLPHRPPLPMPLGAPERRPRVKLFVIPMSAQIEAVERALDLTGGGPSMAHYGVGHTLAAWPINTT